MTERKQSLIDLFNEQSGNCAYCHVSMVLELELPNTATIDHVVPRSKGGKSGRHNELCVCLQCNKEKSNMDLIKFLRIKARDLQHG
jgi:5-methylcytosine-specific restriction endonuclease McrA